MYYTLANIILGDVTTTILTSNTSPSTVNCQTVTRNTTPRDRVSHVMVRVRIWVRVRIRQKLKCAPAIYKGLVPTPRSLSGKQLKKRHPHLTGDYTYYFIIQRSSCFFTRFFISFSLAYDPPGARR